jgi:hypothetical protein
MRLYSNENFPQPVVQELRSLGHDVLTTTEVGKSGQSIPDDQVLAFAIEQKRTLITLNRRHFTRLHEVNPNHFGIIVCSVDPDFQALAQRIQRVLQTNANLIGQLIRINRPGTPNTEPKASLK